MLQFLISRVEINSRDDLRAIKEKNQQKKEYIVIKIQKKSQQFCCIYKDTNKCICNFQAYKIRPHAIQLMRAIRPFFEIVIFSRFHHKVAVYIIDSIEDVIN